MSAAQQRLVAALDIGTTAVKAIVAEGAGSAEFSEHLRSFWPGLDQDP